MAEAADKFDTDGRLTDATTQTVLGIALTKFLELIDALTPGAAA